MKRLFAFILSILMLFTLFACSDEASMENEVSGKAPGTEEKEATSTVTEGTTNGDSLDSAPLTEAGEEEISESDLVYRDDFSLAEAFRHMNALRYTIYEKMYSAVLNLDDDSAWVPVAVSKYTLGKNEFSAAAHVMEKDAEKLFGKQGVSDIAITPLDVENSWKITGRKDNDIYEYTVRYGEESGSYRFTLSINGVPEMLLATIRTAGGYAIEIWTTTGTYHILAHDTKEGRFGFIPAEKTNQLEFPETDIFFEESYVAKEFATEGAEFTFLLANKILYVAKDGSNYAIPLE